MLTTLHAKVDEEITANHLLIHKLKPSLLKNIDCNNDEEGYINNRVNDVWLWVL